ncbi:MAG TPA: hypothetical protein VGB15_16020 [Longimicrobium sp.]|jgi:hypothetical protein
MGIRSTPLLSFEGSREVREEMARGPEDTPQRRRFMALVREMRARREAEELLRAREMWSSVPTNRSRKNMNLVKIAVAALSGALAAALLSRRRVRTDPAGSRKERLRQAYREAANDPAYLAEMAEIDRAFDVTVGDGLEPRFAARP